MLKYMHKLEIKYISTKRIQTTNQCRRKFYNKFIEASKCRNIQQAVTTLTSLTSNDLMPDTIIEDVYRDLVEEHPLLSKVKFQSVAYATKL